MIEALVQSEIFKALSRGARRLHRNNVGSGWAGGGRDRKALRVTPQNLAAARASIRPGDVIVPNARPLHAGLQRGSGDHIGWQTLEFEVAPAMVGRRLRLAAFLSVESKRLRGGRLSPEQQNWMEQVRAAGGIAVAARSVEEAQAEIERQVELLQNPADRSATVAQP